MAFMSVVYVGSNERSKVLTDSDYWLDKPYILDYLLLRLENIFNVILSEEFV
jgi:hypothetical protein